MTTRLTIEIVERVTAGGLDLHPGAVAEFTVGDDGAVLLVQSLPHHLQDAILDAVARGAARIRDVVAVDAVSEAG